MYFYHEYTCTNYLTKYYMNWGYKREMKEKLRGKKGNKWWWWRDVIVCEAHGGEPMPLASWATSPLHTLMIMWPGQISDINNTRMCYHTPKCLKMILQVKKNVFATPQKWLEIFGITLKQVQDNNHIFHFLDPEMVLIDMWWRSSHQDQRCCIAYITHAGTLWLLP